MIKVRRNVFETNSSSTHSIAIPKNKDIMYSDRVTFNIGNYQWRFDDVDPADYLYTAILTYYLDSEERDEKLNKLKEILDNNGIKYKFETPKFEVIKSYSDDSNYSYLDNGGIDHSGELEPFLNAVFESDKTVLDFIFGGFVFTGNDNSDSEEMCFVNRNEKTYESYENGWNKPPVVRDNPYYMEDASDYDWYEKGN